MAVRARAARSGVYQYLGREVDPAGTRFAADEVVNVYRPSAEVFDQASVASFLMKPVTDDHPREAVTADNWKAHAKGVVGKALRDGEHLAFDLVLMDAATIKAVEEGKRELSNGYGCDLSFEDGTAPSGEKYQAVQRGIRGNHVAVVKAGRAGSSCRIGDAAVCDSLASSEIDRILADQRTYDPGVIGDKSTLDRSDANDPNSRVTAQDGDAPMATKTILVDGLQVEVTDAAEAAIKKLQGQLADAASAKSTADAALADANKALDTEKGKVTALEQQVKDAAITPDKLQQMVADRAALVAQAKAVDPKIVTDGKTDAEIRRALVVSQLGDSAKDMSDDAVAGAFAIATKDAKAADPLRDAISQTRQTVVTDNRAVRDLARASQY